VIRAVDGNPIHDTDGLYLEVGKLPVDATTRLSVLRDRRPRTVEVRLTKYPVRGHQVVTNAPPAWRGLRVDYISAWGDRPGGLPQREMAFDRGVIVTDVADDSPAAAAGLKPGMLITKVGDTRVHRPAEFRAALANLPGPVRLSLAEEDDSRVVAVPPPDNSG
jgi:serine protease Do